ncbi:MAG TPA: sugar transferase [Anaerolineae bacterium]|nr:sugar transferase [Anaerolineae bacterium]
MLDSTLATLHAAMDIFLELDGAAEDAANPEEIWQRVEQERKAGRAVWLTGAWVQDLTRRFGVAREGRYWIRIPAGPAQGEWAFRLRDIILSILALVVCAPLFVVLALLVKRSSPGPIFYKTTVVGQGQRRFVCRKFRSMRVMDPEHDQAARREQFRAFVEQKGKGKVIDPTRVTAIGAFLRKHSLDELPQLWNVLRGDMALVGPRPCLPYEIEFFPEWACARFQVRPGLTGLAQVTARGQVTLEQAFMMNVYYAYARSLTLDLKILVDTLRVMLLGEGDK